MTAVAEPQLRSPYRHVVDGSAIADASRLLDVDATDDLVTSDWYRRLYGKSTRSLLELKGLGKNLWGGTDPQAYVDELRDEWDRP
jgi:hypothetical protein